MKREFSRHRDGESVARAAAAAIAARISSGVAARGAFSLVLAGGSTPKRAYELLAAEHRGLAWKAVRVFWGDERCVPPADVSSNFRMAREALLAHVPVAEQNAHRIHGEDEPAVAAAAYEQELRALFRTPAGAPQLRPGARFDLILLGMGDNGHTASLFPGLTAVREATRWVMAEYVAEVSMWRVTLTPVVINAAAEVAFLVSGREKAAMLQRVLEGPHQPDTLPAQVVALRDGRLRWCVDADAAAALKRS